MVVFGFATATRVCPPGTHWVGLHPVPRFGAAVCLEVLTGAPIPLLLVLVPAVGVLLAIGVPATGSVTPSSLFSALRSCSGPSLPFRLRERGARVAFSRGSRPPWSEGSLCVPRRSTMLPSPTAGQIDSGNSRAITRASPWKDQGQRGSCAPLGALVSQTSRRMTQAPHQVPRLTAGFPQG